MREGCSVDGRDEKESSGLVHGVSIDLGGRRDGTNQMLYVKQLSTVMGGEAQAAWRQFVKRDEAIPEGEPSPERREVEREARKIWKRYGRIMWWVDNSNPTLPGAAEEPDEPGIEEPPDLHDFLEEIRKRFRQSSCKGRQIANDPC